uniref:Uncharacterized protein n=1 Tax=Oryza barthii TaxID=65489 RepID=A0A0D3G3R7_9ORYZ
MAWRWRSEWWRGDPSVRVGSIHRNPAFSSFSIYFLPFF